MAEWYPQRVPLISHKRTFQTKTHGREYFVKLAKFEDVIQRLSSYLDSERFVSVVVATMSTLAAVATTTIARDKPHDDSLQKG